MKSPLLLAERLSWDGDGRRILRDVSFGVQPGELVAIMGRNGAGKSTLLDILAGIRRAAQGNVVVDGQTLAKRTFADRARWIAHLPQQMRVDAAVNASALVAMGRYNHQGSAWFETGNNHEIVAESMARCDCAHLADRAIGTLSGGERQRVLLAACLAQRARILLLDEPATFLDADQQVHCLHVLRAEADAGRACMIVTHDINLALLFCTRLIVLADGALAYDTPTDSALDATEWLGLLSHRMIVDDGTSSRPLVRYQ